MLPLSDDSVTDESPLPLEQRPEWVRFARFGGFLRESVRDVIAGVPAMPWHPLKAQRNPCGMDLSSGLVDCVNNPLS
jgi:hypothetical protein